MAYAVEASESKTTLLVNLDSFFEGDGLLRGIIWLG